MEAEIGGVQLSQGHKVGSQPQNLGRCRGDYPLEPSEGVRP